MDKDDEHKRRSEVEQANLAKQILENPLWQEAWDQVIKPLEEGWQKTGTGESEKREMIYQFLRAMKSVKGIFETTLETGKLAERQLQELMDERKRTGDRRTYRGLGHHAK